MKENRKTNRFFAGLVNGCLFEIFAMSMVGFVIAIIIAWVTR